MVLQGNVTPRIQLGSFNDFALRGSYKYHKEVAKEHVDEMVMDFRLNNLQLVATPEGLQSLMNVQDNYFGSYPFPVTSDEFMEAAREGLPGGGGKNLRSRVAQRTPRERDGRPKPSNAMDVALGVSVRGIQALVPLILYPTDAPSSLAPVHEENQFTLHDKPFAIGCVIRGSACVHVGCCADVPMPCVQVFGRRCSTCGLA